MEYCFKNFGTIKNGTIRLNDLTILYGPNNTCKTYISYAVYSTLKKFASLINFGIKEKIVTSALSELNENGSALLDLSDLLNPLLDTKTKSTTIMNSKVHNFLKVPKNHFLNAKVSLKLDELDVEKPIVHDGDFFGNIITYQYQYIDKKSHLKLSLKNPQKHSKSLSSFFKNKDSVKSFKNRINQLLCFTHFAQVIPEPYAITSERTGISLFYKIFDSRNSQILNIIDPEMDDSIITEVNALLSHHALPIENNIDDIRFYESALLNKSIFTSKRTKYKPLLSILSDLLDGGTYESVNGSILFRSNKSNKNDELQIPLHACSSSVKSLFLFDLFIKHVAHKDCILLIDEPELNLGIDKQIKMARLVARLVNSGVKVLVTTHSDYFMREINDLITMSSCSNKHREELMEKYGICNSDILRQSQVSSYKTTLTGTIEDVEILKTGIDPGYWNEFIVEGNRKTEEIYRSTGENNE